MTTELNRKYNTGSKHRKCELNLLKHRRTNLNQDKNIDV